MTKSMRVLLIVAIGAINVLTFQNCSKETSFSRVQNLDKVSLQTTVPDSDPIIAIDDHGQTIAIEPVYIKDPVITQDPPVVKDPVITQDPPAVEFSACHLRANEYNKIFDLASATTIHLEKVELNSHGKVLIFSSDPSASMNILSLSNVSGRTILCDIRPKKICHVNGRVDLYNSVTQTSVQLKVNKPDADGCIAIK